MRESKPVANPGSPAGGGGGGGRRTIGGDAGLRHGCFSVKMYAKMKELDPIGGAHASGAPAGFANVNINLKIFCCAIAFKSEDLLVKSKG